MSAWYVVLGGLYLFCGACFAVFIAGFGKTSGSTSRQRWWHILAQVTLWLFVLPPAIASVAGEELGKAAREKEPAPHTPTEKGETDGG